MTERSTCRSFLAADALVLVPALVGCGANSSEPRAIDRVSGGGIAVLIFAYSAGRGILFILAAFSVTKAMSTFSWARRNARVIMWVGGAMLVVLGVLQVSGLWLELISRFQGVITNWQVPL